MLNRQSRCQREPVRYQWGAYDSMQEEWMQCINLGGTAEVYYGFCPLLGAEAFCIIRERKVKECFQATKRHNNMKRNTT